MLIFWFVTGQFLIIFVNYNEEKFIIDVIILIINSFYSNPFK